jgi:putative aldouronate transport system substrate-binding protein
MIKKLTIVPILALLVLLAFSVTAQDVTVSAPGEFPIVEEPVTLRVLMLGHAIVEDFQTNTFTQWYSEKTGVNVEFDIAPPSEGQQILNLTLASGDLPDVIVGFTIDPSTLAIFGPQGIFLPLNDLIEEQGYFIKEVFEGSPQVEPLIKSPDGNIYGLPQVNECFHCSYAQRMWINQTWLDNLGLEMPQTTEDFYNVLLAFKEQDANGNGDPNDEIPLGGSGSPTGWNTNLDGFLMNPFVYNERGFNSSNEFLMLEDGVISSVVDAEGWREGLRYLKRLHDARLFGEESFTQEPDQLRQLVEGGDVPVLGTIAAGGPPVFANISEPRWHEYTAVPPLAGPTGLRQTPFSPWGIVSGQCVIPATSAYPEVAFKWCDGLFDRETTLRSVFGLPDEQWAWAEEGTVGINGEPAIWRRLSVFNTLQNVHWAQRGPSYRPNHLRLGEVARGDATDLEVPLYQNSLEKMVPYARPQDQVIPPLAFTTEQASELTELKLAISDYVLQMQAEFILGRADLDAGWDTYLATLESLGLPRLVQIYQEAYDASAAAS